MSVIRRGDQTTTDQWLAKRPKGNGAPAQKPTIGRIVWFRSVLTTKTGGPVSGEVPAIITQVHGNGEYVDLVVFRANSQDPTAMPRVPHNDDMTKDHTGAWRWPVYDGGGQ